MKLSFAALPILPLMLVAGCSDPEATGRYLVDPPQAGRQIPNRLGRAELREVVLPEYAAGQEVSWQSADGAVRSNPEAIWADNPPRAVTDSLARQISDLSGATVIAEPWPLGELPDSKIEVRISQMLAGADGVFRLSGRYFVAPDEFGPRADQGDRVRVFDLSVPLAGAGPAAIAAAQSQALALLAAQIAALD